MAIAQELFNRFATALNEGDLEAIGGMLHRDFVADSPQSGERSRGFEAFRAQFTSYPGGVPDTPMPDVRIAVDEQRWAITPSFTVVPLASGSDFTFAMRSQYPDGSWWHVVTLVELRDDKIYRLEFYFAPELRAPLAESIAAFVRG